MEVRKDVLKSMEGLRNEKLIKSNMETKVTLSLKDEYKDIANLKDDLKQLFIVAKVELVDDTTLEEYETSYIKVEKFNGVTPRPTKEIAVARPRASSARS